MTAKDLTKSGQSGQAALNGCDYVNLQPHGTVTLSPGAYSGGSKSRGIGASRVIVRDRFAPFLCGNYLDLQVALIDGRPMALTFNLDPAGG